MTTYEINTRYVHCKEATLDFARYGDDTIAIRVFGDDGDGFADHLTTPTVSLAGYGERPAEGNVFIKDWSENEGTLAALQAAGIIGAPVREVKAGFAIAYECPLLVEVK